MSEAFVSAVLAPLALASMALAGLAGIVLALPGAWTQRDAIVRLAPSASFTVGVVAVSGSLYYSEVAGFEPCELCWYQRIAMYSLAVVLAIALVTRDTRSYRYSLPLALLGASVAAYHYQLQLFPDQSSACSSGVPCTARYVTELGFVSIPLMALAGFFTIGVFQLALRRERTRSSGSR